MHPLLFYTRLNCAPISYDIVFTPSARTVVDRTVDSPIPAVTLAQPATEPPIPRSSRLVLRFKTALGRIRRTDTSPADLLY